MGIINSGIPVQEANYLKIIAQLEVFIESGTYIGNTTKVMSAKFKNIYSIEKQDAIYNITRENLKNISNIMLFNGDTRQYLPSLMADNDSILFGSMRFGVASKLMDRMTNAH
jgi:16S rRNA A1518/A1519 N6-dimethyltransferase RsmA/KsgA/DIM1 with predicted DNA glycosylase/AP lyase activity